MLFMLLICDLYVSIVNLIFLFFKILLIFAEDNIKFRYLPKYIKYLVTYLFSFSFLLVNLYVGTYGNFSGICLPNIEIKIHFTPGILKFKIQILYLTSKLGNDFPRFLFSLSFLKLQNISGSSL